MTDLLIATLLTAFAVTYVLELLDLTIVGEFFGKTNVNVFFSPPLSFGGLYVFYQLDMKLIVAVPASIFLSLMLGRYLNRPTVVSQQRLPRL